jgi:hypothetical protein
MMPAADVVHFHPRRRNGPPCPACTTMNKVLRFTPLGVKLTLAAAAGILLGLTAAAWNWSQTP